MKTTTKDGWRFKCTCNSWARLGLVGPKKWQKCFLERGERDYKFGGERNETSQFCYFINFILMCRNFDALSTFDWFCPTMRCCVCAHTRFYSLIITKCSHLILSEKYIPSLLYSDNQGKGTTYSQKKDKKQYKILGNPQSYLGNSSK